VPKSSSGNPKANENHKDGDRKAKRNGSHLEIFSTLLELLRHSVGVVDLALRFEQRRRDDRLTRLAAFATRRRATVA